MKSMIMGAENVRAILDGRKTRHSFPIKPQPPEGVTWVGWMLDSTARENTKHIGSACWTEGIHYFYAKPRYKVGEIVYVKETFTEYTAFSSLGGIDTWMLFKARGDILPGNAKWRSPLFMSEEDSRIHLEITDIKAQRVQDITEEEAMVEGIEKPIEERCMLAYRDYSIKEEDNEGYNWFSTAKDSYSSLWDSINAKKGLPWESNPWVWVVSFKVVQGC